MRVILAAIAASLMVLGAVPSGAAPKMIRLGTDPAGDGPPALDVTFLDAGRAKDQLEIHIGIDKMIPGTGGYPELPGIEWIFKAGKRAFIAEAVAGRVPRFFLFELKDGSFEQLQGITGTYDWTDGFIRMLVPLKVIGAKKGTVIKGFHEPLDTIDKDEGPDVDAHVHTPGRTEYLDQMKTSKSFRVP